LGPKLFVSYAYMQKADAQLRGKLDAGSGCPVPMTYWRYATAFLRRCQQPCLDTP
jgi:hypothetical protein